MPDRPDALLLDLDGTLSDSGPVIMACIARAPEAVAAPGLGRRRDRLTKPDCVGEALRLLGGPKRPVKVGDRVHDVVGAAAQGVPCLGALWGYEARDGLKGAAALLRRPSEVRYWARPTGAT